MAIMKSKYKYMYDAAAIVALMPKDGAEQVASFNGTALVLDTLQGYWTDGELADQTLAAVINVTDVTNSARTATITLAAVVATDAITISDGVDSITLTADTDYVVGGSDTITATNLAAAINDAFEVGDIAITATSLLAVVTVTNTLGTGGSFSAVDAHMTASAFAGNNETYKIEIEGGPVGFGTSVILGMVPGITAPGQYSILLDMDTAKAIKSNLAAIRIKATFTGVSPSFVAHSWISAIQR